MSRVRNNESLDFQIDKLSEAIESMMKGFETLQTPRVLDNDMIRVKPANHMHKCLTGDEDISDPDSFCKEPEFDPEKIELYFDRVSMANEDFRAFEYRRIENSYESESPWQFSSILETICARINEVYGVALPFSDLEDFISALQKTIDKQIECSLVDLHAFVLRLCDVIHQEKPMNTKVELGNTFLEINIKERPRKRFAKPDYTANYDQNIEKLLQDKDLPEEIKSIGRVKKNLLVNIDLEKIRNTEVDFIREDLEHRMLEVETLKKKLVSQLESLSRFSKQLRQKDIELLKMQERLEDEMEDFNREKRHIEDLEVNYSAKIKEIKSRIAEISPEVTSSLELKPRASYDQRPRASVESTVPTGRISPIVAQFRTSTPVLSTRSLDTSDELSSLQSELSLLESQPQDSASQLRIIRLKTQISTIRSTLAMNNSLRNSVGYIGKVNNDHKRNSSNTSIGDYPVCVSPAPRSGCSSPVVPELTNYKRTAPRPPAPGPRKAPPKVKENSDEIEFVMNQLKIQESRLKEREDMIEEKENRLQRTWMKLPNSEELIGLVQKELNYLAVVKKDYQEKFEELNSEVFTFAKKNSQMKIRERDLENKMIEAGREKKGLEEERKNLESKFEAILGIIESV